MNFNKTIHTTIAVALLLGLAATATAQPTAQSQTQIETDAQASSDTEGILQAISSLKSQVQNLQQRVSSLEEKANLSTEANSEAQATKHAEGKTEVVKGQSEQSPPEHAQNSQDKENLGSKVSNEAKAGDKDGIKAAISAFLFDRGNENAAKAVNSSSNVEAEAESKTETSAEASTKGNIS